MQRSVNQPIVFVGGIHGAGKTTLSRRLAEELSASHVTAGTLIREANSQPTAAGKAVSDVNANQTLLLKGLEHYRRKANGTIVLDGHFSLFDPHGAVVAIPMAVYEAIAPLAIVLVEADSNVVHSRLLERDNVAPPLATISLLSETERAQARAVSAALKIPMFTTRGDIPTIDAVERTAVELLPLLKGVA